MAEITVKATDIRKRLYPENSYDGQYGAIFTDFLSSARKAHPNLTFYRTRNDTAWVMVDKNDLYAVAKITYADARVKSRGSSKPTFNLYSRAIRNRSVNEYRDEHHLTRFSDSAKTIDAIGTYVKPLTVKELVRLTAPEVSSSLDRFFDPLVRKQNMQRRNIGLLPESLAERFMLSVARDNAAALPFELQQVIEFLESHEELNAADPHKRAVHALIIADDGVRVMPVPTGYRYGGVPELVPTAIPGGVEYLIYGLNDLPEIYRGRIDVLNITEPMEFVPGVGTKHSDRLFYVVI
jgi:hypothetical protein